MTSLALEISRELHKRSVTQPIEAVPKALVGERLTLLAFSQLSGNLSGYPYIKFVIDKPNQTIHFINNQLYPFHANYIAENLLGIPNSQLEREIDSFNHSVYVDPNRRFYLGILALHKREERRFFSLETVEVDAMTAPMIQFFYRFVKDHVEPSIPILFKPAHHLQEILLNEIDPAELPRILSHELFSAAEYVALNTGTTKGRIRAFESQKEYTENRSTLEWYDIIVMHRVPDDIPRVSGIINAEQTTPLSHTNVLASGWQIPNAIQIGIFEKIKSQDLNNQWVQYSVQRDSSGVGLNRTERPTEANQRPAWSLQRIKIEEPQTTHTPILSLDRLRMSDRYKYGTKAANLGELRHVLEKGSERLIGFYKVKRPPRANLLPYLTQLLGSNTVGTSPSTHMTALTKLSHEFLQALVQIPRGIALPFSIQQEFLESSPKIQQSLGKLKMALELNARQVDALCIHVQQMIRATRIPDHLRNRIDAEITHELSGVSSFVVRSSSNAEDLENFSAAGIYESINHVTSSEKLFDSIKQVWASLLSPRSVRLRQEMGISLDESYMGVVIQEEIKSTMVGVLVTTNPTYRADFRNVYLNISPKSVIKVVQGDELPYQYLYNTVEGGGRTLSLGNAKTDLSHEQKAVLQKLALAGRLLQSHFSPDYTYSHPVDIEWLANEEGVYILQLRLFTS